MPRIVPAELITQPGPDPHSEMTRLRTQCPVHAIDFPVGSRSYLIVDYLAAEEALRNPSLSKDIKNAPEWFRERAFANSAVLSNSMLGADPPRHTRLRNLVRRAFSPQRLALLRPRIEEIAEGLIDTFPETGEFDLLAEFALPLPMMVICEFLGIRYEDRALFTDWATVLSQDPGRENAEQQRDRRRANDEVERYLTEALAARRAEPQDDYISHMVHTADTAQPGPEASGYSDDELVSTLIVLIIAGHKTTVNLIGNGTAALLRHPDQLARLHTEPHLVNSAVEEFLRYEGSVDRTTVLFAAEDTSLAGVEVPQGSLVHVSLQAANRDPKVFSDPDELDVARMPNRHMAFGRGIHFCAGAPLARLEGQIAFGALLRRVPTLRCAVPVDELEWIADSSVSRGLVSLPVRVDGHIEPRRTGQRE